MDSVIKQCIEGRKIAFTTSYEITKEYKKKIDDLFIKIEEFGKTCVDAMDFENKFMDSPLNKEYTNLFTEIATNCKPIIKEALRDENIPEDKEYLKQEVVSEAKYIAEDLTMPARRKAREEFDKKMRDTPLGKIEQASNTLWVFKRLFGKKNKIDDE